MSKYDQRKRELQSLIDKEAQHLSSTFTYEVFSAFKYNHYRLKLLLVRLFQNRAR